MELNQSNDSPRMEWSNLYRHLLGNIYSFLGRKDQLNMLLVSKWWWKAYDFPPLWETFTFKLTNLQLKMDPCPVIKFVERYGSMFRHVKIEYKENDHYTKTREFGEFGRDRYIWDKHFREFLRTLRNSNPKLESVEFVKLKDLLMEVGNPTYKCLCRAIADFLGSQDELKQVKFFHCYFRFPQGVEVLRRLIASNGETLRHLRLREFVSYETGGEGPISDFTQNLPMLSDLPNLTTLDIDYYSLIFSKMVSQRSLQALKNRNTSALLKIILLYDDSPLPTRVQRLERTDEFRAPRPADWLFLKLLAPNLQVELTIQVHSLSMQTLRFLITQSMPITRLEYITESINNMFKLYDHLLECQTNNYLVSLHLRMNPPDEDLVSPLNRFLPAFKKLKFLELSIPHSTDISNLIEYWRQNPLEYLEKVVIHITDIRNNGHYSMVQNLTSGYASQLESISMNVVVDIDYKPTES